MTLCVPCALGWSNRMKCHPVSYCLRFHSRYIKVQTKVQKSRGSIMYTHKLGENGHTFVYESHFSEMALFASVLQVNFQNNSAQFCVKNWHINHLEMSASPLPLKMALVIKTIEQPFFKQFVTYDAQRLRKVTYEMRSYRECSRHNLLFAPQIPFKPPLHPKET